MTDPNPSGFTQALEAICRERCASFGDPPCWKLPDLIKPCDHITPCSECWTDLLTAAEARAEAAEAERDALKAENERLREALAEVDRHLTNLQPHIPQSCKPGHEGFIDSYVDPALDAIRAALDKAATLAALQEKTDG